MVTPPEPTSVFNIKEQTLTEVEEVVKVARTCSGPGPSGVPYVVYKRCPRLLKQTVDNRKSHLEKGEVAQQWRHAEGVWIPKEYHRAVQGHLTPVLRARYSLVLLPGT